MVLWELSLGVITSSISAECAGVQHVMDQSKSQHVKRLLMERIAITLTVKRYPKSY